MATRTTKAPRSLVTGPSVPELRRLLGRRYALFERVAHPTPDATGEWRCYKKGGAQLLKVLDRTRTLYYVRPAREAVHVSFLLSQRACDGAPARRLRAPLRAAVEAAPVYPEGRAVRLALHRLADAADVEALLAVKLARS